MDSLASSRICGASPLVGMVMWRAPMPRPHEALMMRIAALTERFAGKSRHVERISLRGAVAAVADCGLNS